MHRRVCCSGGGGDFKGVTDSGEKTMEAGTSGSTCLACQASDESHTLRLQNHFAQLCRKFVFCHPHVPMGS